jgi:hypothetical protein
MKKKFLEILTCTTLLVGGNISSTSNDTASAATPTFKDVKSNYWAQLQINYLANNGLIGGYPDGAFKPNDNLTRAQAAKMLVKAFKLPTNNRPNPKYKDVPTGHHGYKAIATITDAGLMSGSNGSFRPEETLTRAQMAAILTTAFKLKEGSTYKNFKDVTKNHWAYNPIQMIASNRVTTGYADGTFRPSQPTTRAQFAVFLAVNLKPEIFQPRDREEVTRKANETFRSYGHVSQGFVTSYGSWIYRLVQENPNDHTGYIPRYNIYREKIDGTQKKKLTADGEVIDANIQIVNGKIYYFTKINNTTKMRSMNLDGTNKQDTNGPELPAATQTSNQKWSYTVISSAYEYWDFYNTQIRYNLEVIRTNTVTGEKTRLDVYLPTESRCIGHIVTDKGIYIISDHLAVYFVPNDQTKAQLVDVNSKLAALGLKVEKGHMLISRGLLIDRDNYYFLIENYSTSKNYLIKYDNATNQTTVIKEFSKPNGYYSSRLDNIYDGYAYYSTYFQEKQKAKIYRIPLTGGTVQTMADLPKAHKYSLIEGNLHITRRGNTISKIALPK